MQGRGGSRCSPPVGFHFADKVRGLDWDRGDLLWAWGCVGFGMLWVRVRGLGDGLRVWVPSGVQDLYVSCICVREGGIAYAFAFD